MAFHFEEWGSELCNFTNLLLSSFSLSMPSHCCFFILHSFSSSACDLDMCYSFVFDFELSIMLCENPRINIQLLVSCMCFTTFSSIM